MQKQAAEAERRAAERMDEEKRCALLEEIWAASRGKCIKHNDLTDCMPPAALSRYGTYWQLEWLEKRRRHLDRVRFFLNKRASVTREILLLGNTPGKASNPVLQRKWNAEFVKLSDDAYIAEILKNERHNFMTGDTYYPDKDFETWEDCCKYYKKRAAQFELAKSKISKQMRILSPCDCMEPELCKLREENRPCNRCLGYPVVRSFD